MSDYRQLPRSGNSYFLPSPFPRFERNGDIINTKFILVSGGVCSSLGKGVTTSSIGALLRAKGYRISSIKIDPYINVDAGLMSPYEHGEVYVLDDGGESDLDLGNYERWMGIHLTRDHNITTGKVYQTLINDEREGKKFLGKTVTLVPHFTNEVVERIERIAAIPVDGSGLRPHICMIELGGTVGDFESAPFIEALRTLRFTLPPEDFCLFHCTYLPVMGGSQKTKPTQHSCRSLLSLGLSADFLICRSENPLEETTREKLSQLCGIKSKYIMDACDVHCLYEVPCMLAAQDLVAKIEHKLCLDANSQKLIPPMNFPDISTFKHFVEILEHPQKTVRIAFVGKYLAHGTDAYFSVMQTFEHCCIALSVGVKFIWMDSLLLEGADAPETEAALKGCDGVFVPGGFGTRGIDGKIRAVQIARENKIPYFGVCLGMQMAIIEHARNVLKLPAANSEEFDPKSPDPFIVYMPPENNIGKMGANMRLGAEDCYVVDRSEDCILNKIYNNGTLIRERHRHRYEFNMKYRTQLERTGLRITGISEPNFGPNCRVEAVERNSSEHPFFFAVQYHPEFISAPCDPSPPYLAFLAAAAGIKYYWRCGVNSRVVK